MRPSLTADAPAPGCDRLPRRLPPVVVALGCQALAALAVAWLPAPPSPWLTALMQGGVAALLGHWAGLPGWWLPLNLLCASAGHGLAELAIAPHWFLAGFVALTLLYWTTYRTRVPLFLSSAEACEQLDALLPTSRGLNVIDLGCGLGDVLGRLAPARPDTTFVGVEVAPLPALVAWLRTRRLANARVVRGDFWRERLDAYDVVYAFLSPAAMPGLWRKATAEMKRGSLLVSNSFAIPGVEPDLVIPLSGRGSSALYVWRL